jgi:CHASE2 domain-containing sensor protein
LKQSIRALLTLGLVVFAGLASGGVTGSAVVLAQSHEQLLPPVSEPVALLLTGIAMLAFARRVRRPFSKTPQLNGSPLVVEGVESR